MQSESTPDAETLSPKDLSDLIARLSAEARHEEAARFALRLIVLRPGHRRALRALHRVRPEGFDLIGAWRRLRAAEPDDEESAVKLGQLCLDVGRHEEAESLAAAALRRNPGNVAALVLRVRSTVARGAASVGQVWNALADVDAPQASSLLQSQVRAPGTPSGAVDSLLAAGAARGTLSTSEHRVFVHRRAIAMAVALSAEVGERPIEAGTAYRRLAVLTPDDLEVKAGIARILPALLRLLTDGSSEARSEAAALIVRLAPETGAVHRHLAERVAGDEPAPEAPELLDELLDRLDAASEADRALLIGICLRLERLDDAVRIWRALGGKEQTAALLEENRALLDRSLVLKDWPTANACLARGVELGEPDLDAMRRRFTGALRGALRPLAGDDPARLELLRYLHRIAPDDPDIALRFGRHLMRERYYQEALPLWRAMSAAAPKEPELHLQVARCARKLGFAEEALTAAQQVLALDASHAEAARYRAELGPASAGRAALQKA